MKLNYNDKSNNCMSEVGQRKDRHIAKRYMERFGMNKIVCTLCC